MAVGLFVNILVLVTVCTAFQFKHHNNEELVQLLEDVHLRCPNISRVYTLSETSVNGNPLVLIEFSDNPGIHEISKLNYPPISFCFLVFVLLASYLAHKLLL